MDYRSWKTTYVALSQLNPEADNTSLRRHLTDPQTIYLLARSTSPYSAPTLQTKSTFDTKTSSVHVPPSGNPRYDIGQIKEDTLWLSKETKIDEVSALRIAVLEWQTRPAVQLLRGNLVDEIAPLANGIGGSFSGILCCGFVTVRQVVCGSAKREPSFRRCWPATTKVARDVFVRATIHP